MGSLSARRIVSNALGWTILFASIQYVLKPKAGIVVNLEYAAGKSGNYGVYLKMGYGF
jgi:hypothetical protein